MKLDQLISYWGIGSGSPQVYPRYVQFISPTLSWKQFVEAYINPQRKLGVNRFLLYMPFGQEITLRTQVVNRIKFDTRLRFDQYQQALATGLTYITEGFVEAIRPLVDDGCQVIAYTGTPGGAPEIERRRWDRKKFLYDCLAPFRAANCDIAIDSACRSPAGDYVDQLANQIRTQTAAKVYCESMPRVEAAQWAKGDVISVEEQYQNALIKSNQNILVDPAKIDGEIIRLFTSVQDAYVENKAMNWAKWYREKVPGVTNPRHSVCLHLRSFLDAGGKLEELTA